MRVRVPSAHVNIVSLCTGTGALDAAVQSVFGGDLIWYSEFDPKIAKIMAHHRPDLTNVGDLKQIAWPTPGEIDILTAGYPCQPFSAAGKRQGANDERHLWPYIAKGIGISRPRFVVLENVRGHLSLGAKEVLQELARLGYDCRWGVVRASDAGAPHQRARWFCLATNTDRHGYGGSEDGGRVGRLAGGDEGTSREREWSRSESEYRGPKVARDTEVRGRGHALVARPGSHREPARATGGPDSALAVSDGKRLEGERSLWDETKLASAFGNTRIAWGDYEPAIRRWERVLGRSAPDPTELGVNGQARLAAPFVEWMMGLPEGHVTNVPDLSRNMQIKALGNGVVVWQAELALRTLLSL